MIRGKRVLAIIPARGGSKGIPRKNIRPLAGKPLIAWTIEEAKKSKYIDRSILSSEDEEIIQVAKEYGCEVPFIRPRELALDNTPSIDTVIHAINTLPERYDYLCLLQPTSPLRKVQDIDACIKKCIDNNAESCVSVMKVDKHPYWMFQIDENGMLKSLYPDQSAVRRQDLPEIYVLNGAIYMATINQILQQRVFINKDTVAYEMDKKSSIDIDDEVDFKFAETMIREY